MADPERSCLRVISAMEFDGLSEMDQQRMLKSKDVLVYPGQEVAEPAFDRRLLLTTAGSMTRCFTVHGMPLIKTIDPIT
jgi:hypothetical protein